MPTYVYRFVDTGETIEIQQAFTDATLTEVAHPSSGEVMAVKKVFTPVGVTFKGSGFFKTDNRGKPTKTEVAAPTGSTATGEKSATGDAPAAPSPKTPAPAAAAKPATSSSTPTSGSSSTPT